MTPKHLLSFIIIFLIFTSCQKSVDWSATTGSNTGSGGTGNTGGTTGDLLMKVVAVTGNESFTIVYTYDAAKRLISEDLKGTSGGMVIDTYKRYDREANGRIYKVAQSLMQAGIPVDSSYTYVYYPNATTKNFTYTTSDVTVAGFGSHDSSVFVWNSAGNIVSQNSYMSSTFMPGLIIGKFKWDFTYSNGNMTQQKAYAELSPGGSLSLVSTVNYTYDNNPNPLISDGEFTLTGRYEGASKNNVTKMEIIDATSSSNNRTMITSLTYGAGKKPTGGTATMQPQNEVTRYTFYYQ